MLTAKLRTFFEHEAAGGLVMIFCAAMAMLIANSMWSEYYEALLKSHLGPISFSFVVNDVLMAVFFLLVGMELKREMKEGFLAERTQKILPLIAAAGGVVLPALIYIAINFSLPAHHAGWAIPTATDIAFAVCVLSLCGKRVPTSAKIFLLAIAIYDDLSAIGIIAVFYSHGIVLTSLLASAGVLAVMLLLNRRGMVSLPLYLLLGVALWYFVHAAGIHSTVAGMLTGLLIPMRKYGKNSPSPLNHLLHHLHPYVAFAVLPLFAFANAGVSLTGLQPAMLLEPLPLGIALGLCVGKPLGILGATYAAVRLNIAIKPEGTSWGMLGGISIIAGIGFTMSLFIGLLAFSDPGLRHAITLGVMAGSLISALLGVAVMRRALARH